MGIARPVYLEQPNEIQIKNFSFETLLISDSSANIRIKFNVDEPFDSRMKINIIIKDLKQRIEFVEVPKKGMTEFAKEYVINNPIIWWPNGYGEPHLYDLE